MLTVLTIIQIPAMSCRSGVDFDYQAVNTFECSWRSLGPAMNKKSLFTSLTLSLLTELNSVFPLVNPTDPSTPPFHLDGFQ